MFTGIVEGTGKIASLKVNNDTEKSDDKTILLKILCDVQLLEDITIGDSVAVDGVCLTATKIEREGYPADKGAIEFGVCTETQRCTTLNFDNAAPGRIVHLERALVYGKSRVGGHLAQGHVDCTGTLLAATPESGSLRLRISVPRNKDTQGCVVHKGFVLLDGVSLTACMAAKDATVDSSCIIFEVVLVPHTQKVVHLGSKRVGDNLNIEFDMVAKYVREHMSALCPPK